MRSAIFHTAVCAVLTSDYLIRVQDRFDLRRCATLTSSALVVSSAHPLTGFVSWFILDDLIRVLQSHLASSL